MITVANNDHIGNKVMAERGVLTGELSFYVVSRNEVIQKGNNGSTFFDEESQTTKTVDEMIFIPPVDDVISCYYFPYMNYDGLGTEDVYFDYTTFPFPSDCEQLQKDLILHRVNHIGTNSLTDIGRFDKWVVNGTDIGGTWKWQNEGKLWLPPYTTMLAFDGMTEPMEINPLLFKNDLDTFAISVRHSLNHLGAYTLYVEGYRGDVNGKLYGQTCTGLAFPTVSHAYTEYMHHNQASLHREKWNRVVQGMTGVMSNAVRGQWGGVANSVANTWQGHQQMKATMNQTQLSGYSLTGEGSNALHDIQFLGGMQVVHQQYLPEYMQEIGYYFHRFGYKQNKLMTPNLNSRKYFNYLKGEIIIHGEHVPPEYLSKLTRQFSEGATVWHLSESGNFIGNYEMDNVEV